MLERSLQLAVQIQIGRLRLQRGVQRRRLKHLRQTCGLLQRSRRSREIPVGVERAGIEPAMTKLLQQARKGIGEQQLALQLTFGRQVCKAIQGLGAQALQRKISRIQAVLSRVLTASISPCSFSCCVHAGRKPRCR